ncbi:transposase family protein [Nostoc sp.]|uniref:transposase family protein n=1 Tax=Nostoc sp. TaxID=1180 RepID=UPI002FF099C7
MTSKFQEYFTEVKNPRVERTRYHLLTDIITIAILAVIAGAQGWEDIEEYGQQKRQLSVSRLSARTSGDIFRVKVCGCPKASHTLNFFAISIPLGFDISMKYLRGCFKSRSESKIMPVA